MQKTQEKILIVAIDLFNKGGVSTVRLQDIATEAAISPGNLTYHYKTKKDLMEAVLFYMTDKGKKLKNISQSFIEDTDVISILKAYLRFQIGFRFFYRDILEIIKVVPSAKDLFEKQIYHVTNFSKTAIHLSIDKGIMLPEPHDGHYDLFAKNAWAILHSWLTEREVLGEKKVSLYHAILAVLELHFHYLTDSGKIMYHEIKEQLPSLVNEEVMHL